MKFEGHTEKDNTRTPGGAGGWWAAGTTVVAMTTGVFACHGVLYPWLIVGVESPSIYRWFVAVSPVLLATLLIGRSIHSLNDWLVATCAGSLILQLYEFVAARNAVRPFLKSLAVDDPVAYWGRPFLGRVVGVAFLLALSAFAVEGLRALGRVKRSQSSRE
ncbi:MAG: hypothetical protein AAF658_09665 [Myxococcota bacterium]